MRYIVKIHNANLTDHIQADLYYDGTLEISSGDDLIATVQLDDPTPNSGSARKAMKYALGKVGEAAFLAGNLQIEGRDFEPRPIQNQRNLHVI